MIRACSWCSADNCGVITPDGKGNHFRAPSLITNEELTILVNQPVKNLARMTAGCRASLCAAGLVMKTCGWPNTPPGEVGLVGAGYEGCMIADQNYFRDYVASGRSLGRGSLFIYTLPSSTLGEVAIALNLTGPGIHIQGERDPLGTLVRQAARLVSDGEADAMLALWSDATSAVCLAIDGTSRTSSSALFPSPGTPGEGQGGGEAMRQSIKGTGGIGDCKMQIANCKSEEEAEGQDSPSSICNWQLAIGNSQFPLHPGASGSEAVRQPDSALPPPRPSPGVPGEGERDRTLQWLPLPIEPDPTSLARRLATLAGSQ